MADKMQRYDHEMDYMYREPDGDYVKYADVEALHASIIDQGRLTLIGNSGKSFGEYIDWVMEKLEGK